MLSESLEQVDAASIMQRAIVCATADMTAAEVAELLVDEGLSGVPVVGDDGKIEGIVSRADIVRALEEATVDHDDPDNTETLDDLMTGDIMMPAPFTLSAGEQLPEIMRFFLKGRLHRAFVVADRRLLGVVTPFDVLKVLLEDDVGTAPTPDDD